MDLKIKGKRALITGSTSGIGEAIAKALAAEGVLVVVHGRKEAQAQRVVREILNAGGTAVAALGDLGSDAEAAQVVTTSVEAFGGIDILVNNAGAFPTRTFLQSTAAEWVDLYNANVGSVVRLVTALVPGMQERGWGRVIMLGSFFGPMPQPYVANYATTKAANIAQAVSLAKELGGTGVTVNTVSPGPIRTPGMEEGVRKNMAAQGQPYDFDAFAKDFVADTRLPAGKLGEPADVANAVAFLASDLSGYITGANLRVDGGMVPTTN